MSTVLVASGGGHLQQLFGLAPRLGLGPDVVWVTPNSGLSEGLLRGQRAVEIPYSPPRDWRAALRLVSAASQILTDAQATRIVSTGASPAPPFFLAGSRLGLEMHYIESATRSTGPSLSGRLAAKLPAVQLYTQYPSWATERWHFAGSIFDPYTAARFDSPTSPVRRVVVTLGTEAFGFRRAVERLLRVLPRSADVLWQTGHTDVAGLGLNARPRVPSDELRTAMAEADVVISHAGTGSALTAFELGKAPLLLPREAKHGEHIDDHQKLTAAELTRRGLAVASPVEALTEEHLDHARRIHVLRDPVTRPFELVNAGAPTRARVFDLGARRRTVAVAHRSVPAVIDLRDSTRAVIDLRTPARPSTEASSSVDA